MSRRRTRLVPFAEMEESAIRIRASATVLLGGMAQNASELVMKRAYSRTRVYYFFTLSLKKSFFLFVPYSFSTNTI